MARARQGMGCVDRARLQRRGCGAHAGAPRTGRQLLQERGQADGDARDRVAQQHAQDGDEVLRLPCTGPRIGACMQLLR